MSVDLSDVDRSQYENIELRVAQHPSESLHYMWTRIIGYCLSYAPGIRLSKQGLSNADEPPMAIWGPDGTMETWLDVGAPSAERLHKASKAARRVVLYSSVGIAQLRKEASRKRVHRLEEIDVWSLPAELLDALSARTSRSMKLELVRTEGHVYATLDGDAIEAQVVKHRLSEP